MKFETHFSCGDMGWVFNGETVKQRTVGQIRVKYTRSEGLNNGRVDNTGIRFSNYVPKPEDYEESYMCVETGIDSGTVYTLGKSIFATREECERANAGRIAELKREQAERKAREKERLLSQEAELRCQLARIEALKAEQPA